MKINHIITCILCAFYLAGVCVFSCATRQPHHFAPQKPKCFAFRFEKRVDIIQITIEAFCLRCWSIPSALKLWAWLSSWTLRTGGCEKKYSNFIKNENNFNQQNGSKFTDNLCVKPIFNSLIPTTFDFSFDLNWYCFDLENGKMRNSEKAEFPFNYVAVSWISAILFYFYFFFVEMDTFQRSNLYPAWLWNCWWFWPFTFNFHLA